MSKVIVELVSQQYGKAKEIKKAVKPAKMKATKKK